MTLQKNDKTVFGFVFHRGFEVKTSYDSDVILSRLKDVVRTFYPIKLSEITFLLNGEIVEPNDVDLRWIFLKKYIVDSLVSFLSEVYLDAALRVETARVLIDNFNHFAQKEVEEDERKELARLQAKYPESKSDA